MINRLTLHFEALDVARRRGIGEDRASGVANTEHLSPEEARREFACSFSIEKKLKKEINKVHLESFKAFLQELGTSVDALVSLDKSSPEYKQAYTVLAREFEKRAEEFSHQEDSLNAGADALKQFLESMFVEDEIIPAKTILATLLLECRQGLIMDILQPLLTKSTPLSTNFLKIVESAKLSENPTIFTLLYSTAIEAMEDSNGKQKARVISNLINLSPGVTPEARASYLLNKSREYEQSLLDDYNSAFTQLKIMGDEDDEEGGIAVLDYRSSLADSDNDGSRSILVEQIDELKEEIIATRHFMNQLYRSKIVGPLITDTDILELLSQRNPLNEMSDDDLSDLIDGDDDGLGDGFDGTNLFDEDLFVRTFETAIKRMGASEQAEARLEEIIIDLNRALKFHFIPVTAALDSYCEHFMKGAEPNDFLVNLVEDSDTQLILKYKVIDKIAGSARFQSLLKQEFLRGEYDHLVALFAIASKRNSLFEPLKTFLGSLSPSEFTDCLNRLEGESFLEFDEDLHTSQYDYFNNVQLLSIVTDQFKWDEVKDPVSINLVQHLRQLSYSDFKRIPPEEMKGASKISQFIQKLRDTYDPQPQAKSKAKIKPIQQQWGGDYTDWL